MARTAAPNAATRLRETPDAAPQGARVIDVEFKVLRKPRKQFSKRAMAFLGAVFAAAAIGLCAPYIVMFVRGVLSE